VVVRPRNLAGCEQILSRRDAGLWIAQRRDRWSSVELSCPHAHSALDPLAVDHALSTGGSVRRRPKRQTAYRALFRAALDDGVADALRAATTGGRAHGDARFKRGASHHSRGDGRAKLQRTAAKLNLL
jgi:hypothetical protein